MFIPNSGEKRANYFAQIMFKHSLDIEAAFSAESVILYHLSTAVFFALAKTAIITHNTVAYARGPL